MILHLIMSIIIKIISTIFMVISDWLPEIDFVRYTKAFFDLIGTVLQSSVNFLYLILGEAMYPLLLIANLLLTYRFIIFPVVVLVRRLIIKGGDE